MPDGVLCGASHAPRRCALLVNGLFAAWASAMVGLGRVAVLIA
jgi:hypothetical protein